jgi:PASTA domain/Divergent InlB B-repeat domain
VPNGWLVWGGNGDFFSGITTFEGSAAGNTDFVASAAGGYSFNGFGSGPVTSTTALTASFTLLPSYTLSVAKSGSGSGTVTSSPAGIDCGSACSHGYTSGTSVTLTASAASGSTFAGWSGACSGSGNCSVPMTSAASVTATFALEPSYVLSVTRSGAGTVTSSPAGIDCGTACSHSYTTGTSVTLTAAAAAGSTFEGWSGACTGKSSCTVAMTAAESVHASFLKDCVVPKVKGKSLKAAERLIKGHDCRVGKIGHAFSKTVKKGSVISQKPRPGQRRPPGAKVSLGVSKGKRRH